MATFFHLIRAREPVQILWCRATATQEVANGQHQGCDCHGSFERNLYLVDAEFTTGVVLPVDGGATAGRW
jgi:hypothetical protein